MVIRNENILLLSDQDKKKYERVLLKYYIDQGLSESDAQFKINEVFAQCQIGWDHCPRNIDTRIKMKTGFQWKSHENLHPRKKKELEVEVVEESNEEIGTDGYLFKYLTKGEQNWWNERKESYRKEFEFNNSSDFTLLTQLLFEELLQRRLFVSQLQNKRRDYNKQFNDSLKRVADLQVKLGITRGQRAGILDNIDGNIADISVSLEEKLEHLKEIESNETQEELMYGHLKAQKPPYNILPPKEKIEAILKTGEDYIPQADEKLIKEVEKIEPLLERTRDELPIGEII